MRNQQHAPFRQFYDKLDKKYGHRDERGQLYSRVGNRLVVKKSLRSQTKGHRQSVPAPSLVWWLKTGKIPERIVEAIDGNRRNLRFDILELVRTAEDRFKAKPSVWLEWWHSSEEKLNE
ncbi:HNH endonuclease [Mariniblastus sp.]|nr:HNH endonuclease [Mariniblastus sp.]